MKLYPAIDFGVLNELHVLCQVAWVVLFSRSFVNCISSMLLLEQWCWVACCLFWHWVKKQNAELVIWTCIFILVQSFLLCFFCDKPWRRESLQACHMPLIKASLSKWRWLREGFAVEHGAHGGSMMTQQILFRLQILQSTLLLLLWAVRTNRSGIIFE